MLVLDKLFWIGLVGAAVALLFAWLQSNKVRAFSEGNDTMKKIAAAIRQAAAGAPQWIQNLLIFLAQNW